MSIKDIHINQLRVGMYICELDLPWIKNPFFRQKLLIKNASEVTELKNAGCNRLKIDISKGVDVEDKQPEKIKIKSAPAKPAVHIEINTEKQITEEQKKVQPSLEEKKLIKRPQAPSNSVEDFNQRQKAALAIRSQTMDAIQEINSQISRGNPIKQEKILPLVDNLIEELNENEQAILASLNIKSNQGFLNAHLYNTMALTLSAGASITGDIHELMLIGQAALLHDIGWTKLPGYLIQKGRPFTMQEEKLAKQHVGLALSQLKSFPDIPAKVIELIASHHEQPNGQGYPKNIDGEKLDKSARLLSIAVRYDEITHALFDNLGMLPAKAMKQLFKEASLGKFDSKQVSGFIHLLGVYPIGSAVKLSDNSKGIIVHHQPDSPLKPQVMLYYNEHGKELSPPLLLNTKSIKGLEISGFVDPDNTEEDPEGLLRATEDNA